MNRQFIARSGVAFAVLALGIVVGAFIVAPGVHTGDGAGPAAPAPAAEAAGQGGAATEPEILYWVAPMDPDYRRDGPGKSPMGMDLVPVYADRAAADGDDAIRISPAVEHNLGVRTETVRVRPLWRRVNATGYVGFDEERISRLHVRAEGWVENVRVMTVGDRVRRGDPLFDFYSPEIVNAQQEYLLARKHVAGGMRPAAREKLLALGMVPAQIDELERRGTASRTIRVEAAQDGIVTELQARDGMYLTPATEVMSLVDLSHVWILAEVFESQAGWVAPGQAAEARLAYLPGEVFSGTVEYVYPVLDPQTRTLRVRLQFDNPGERLKPNMYASVTIFGKTHQDALTVHRDALIRAADNDRVIVALGDGRYQAREVMTGIESGEWIEVIAGLASGDRVVTSAQFLLDSEASLAGSFRRLDAADRSGAGRGPVNVFGSGIVEAIDRAGRSMIIRHGPIDALGWPGMTMKFDVDRSVELERIRVAQNVHFAIEPDERGVYRVTMVHLVDSDDDKVGDTGAEPMNHEGMDHEGMDHEGMDHD
ncbi:MAG: efflux RND transporter periplasmic adaptor subunit [Xanthomonadales bacterium]